MAPLSTNSMLRIFFPIALKIDEKSEKSQSRVREGFFSEEYTELNQFTSSYQ